MDLIETNSGPRHPWEKSRAAFFRSTLARTLGHPAPPSVLDCGAGDAYFANSLLNELGSRIHAITCWDSNYSDEAITELGHRYPSLHFTRELPKNAMFGAVLMLDVMEHVEDDVGFVRSIVETHLEPGGLILISVPAWQPLYSRHDAVLLHHRRYSPKACNKVLEAAGIHIDECGGLFHSLLLPRAITVLGEHAAKFIGRPLPPIEIPNIAWSGGAAITAAIDGALYLDNTLSRMAARAGLRMPGLSYWAIGHKQR
ncbi:MAG: class I SAM-dependent methyltransferase [Polyangiaceae bacterium]|nr:class I SAM-dependent methyltransferase [Polyangiaceae bacterium]